MSLVYPPPASFLCISNFLCIFNIIGSSSYLSSLNSPGAAGVAGVRVCEALQGPCGDRVRDGIGEVEGGKGVQAFDVAAIADAGDPGTVAGAVSLVGVVYGFYADGGLRFADAAGRFEARYGGV